VSLFAVFAFVNLGLYGSECDQRYKAAYKCFFFESTKLPPHAVQRTPITVRLIMILSKSISVITGMKLHTFKLILK